MNNVRITTLDYVVFNAEDGDFLNDLLIPTAAAESSTALVVDDAAIDADPCCCFGLSRCFLWFFIVLSLDLL